MIKAYSLAIAALICSKALANDGLGHQQVKQPYPLPSGWIPNPKLTFNNSQPPLIFIEQGDTTTITFPKEISKCRQSSAIFQVKELSNDTSVYEIDIITRKEGISELKAAMETRGKTVYDSSFVNLNCRFKNGKLAILRLKLYPYPYYSVQMIVPKQRRDYSAFIKITDKPDMRATPYHPPAQTKKKPMMVSHKKRDYRLFVEVLGDKL